MIRFFADHPTAANLMMVAFLVVGLAFAPTVKRETFPDIPARSVEVQVPFPGATALDVEEAVCQRIEDAADGIDNRDETRCEAREGLAKATLVMREGRDLDRFLDDVKSKVDAITDFPEAAEEPVVRQLGRSDFVAFIAVAGPLRPEGLKAYAERMKDDLLAMPGVAQVTIRGFSQHQVRIEVAASTMRQFGLSLRDLADAVAAQSLKLPVGTVETRESTVLIRFDDERRRPRDFDGLVVVGSESGAAIRLGDIATITDRFEREEDRAFFNGQRAAFLAVEKGQGRRHPRRHRRPAGLRGRGARAGAARHGVLDRPRRGVHRARPADHAAPQRRPGARPRVPRDVALLRAALLVLGRGGPPCRVHGDHRGHGRARLLLRHDHHGGPAHRGRSADGRRDRHRGEHRPPPPCRSFAPGSGRHRHEGGGAGGDCLVLHHRRGVRGARVPPGGHWVDPQGHADHPHPHPVLQPGRGVPHPPPSPDGGPAGRGPGGAEGLRGPVRRGASPASPKGSSGGSWTRRSPGAI